MTLDPPKPSRVISLYQGQLISRLHSTCCHDSPSCYSTSPPPSSGLVLTGPQWWLGRVLTERESRSTFGPLKPTLRAELVTASYEVSALQAAEKQTAPLDEKTSKSHCKQAGQ